MSEHEHPPTESAQDPGQPTGGPAPNRAAGDHDPLVGPGDVDPVDHPVDTVRIDGEEGSIPGEWL